MIIVNLHPLQNKKHKLCKAINERTNYSGKRQYPFNFYKYILP